MEWTKVKVNYILDSDIPDNQNFALVKLMCLTARLEVMPTQKQMCRYVHHKTLKALKETLNEQSINLQDILIKVLKDVQEVVNQKEYWKNKKAQQREKLTNVQGDIQEMSSHKIREDKIREDNKEKSNKKEIGQLKLKNEFLHKITTKDSAYNLVNENLELFKNFGVDIHNAIRYTKEIRFEDDRENVLKKLDNECELHKKEEYRKIKTKNVSGTYVDNEGNLRNNKHEIIKKGE